MNQRERVLAVIRHEKVDRLRTDLWATPEITLKLKTYLRVESTIELYDKLGIDGIFRISPPYIGSAAHHEDDYWEDEWGMGYRWQKYQTGKYSEQVRYPLAEAETIADLEAYAWPSPNWYDYDALSQLFRQYPERALICGYEELYYYHWRLRGPELGLMDLMLRPEFSHYLIGRLSGFWHDYNRRCFEVGRGRIDTATVGDDWGTQHGLVVSPRFSRSSTASRCSAQSTWRGRMAATFSITTTAICEGSCPL
jgi:uroporphyrinogen decarboxylase